MYSENQNPLKLFSEIGMLSEMLRAYEHSLNICSVGASAVVSSYELLSRQICGSMQRTDSCNNYSMSSTSGAKLNEKFCNDDEREEEETEYAVLEVT